MEFNLKLNEQQVNTLLAGLGELPAKVSLDLIRLIQMTAQQQISEQQAAVAEE